MIVRPYVDSSELSFSTVVINISSCEKRRTKMLQIRIVENEIVEYTIIETDIVESEIVESELVK